uniref:ADP-ribosylation factor-like protein 5A n=1 Tax=Macaca fascicularis TaxID=9541 RepID=G7PKK8_MACFA
MSASQLEPGEARRPGCLEGGVCCPRMGILFTRIWRLFNHQEHKVIIVGLDNAGKTTILYQFSMNEVVHTSPTIGSNVEEIVINNTRFLMWDIGGQESLRSSWNTYYTNTEFVIVVVDSTDRERISVTREELYKMLAHEDLRKAGLLIFANKQDVKECMTVAEISQFLKLTSIKDHQWHIQACCALTGEGLCQGLEWMMSRLKIR